MKYVFTNAHEVAWGLLFPATIVFAALFPAWMATLDDETSNTHTQSATVLWWVVKVVFVLLLVFIATPAS